MILVDSSVWIDYFRGAARAETHLLDTLLGTQPLLIGDLIVAEVLQGFENDADFRQAKSLLDAFEAVPLGGKAICEKAAGNFRVLRRRGVSVRKTIDTIIARSGHSRFTFLISRRFTSSGRSVMSSMLLRPRSLRSAPWIAP